MNWTRAKTIIFFMLLTLNLALAAFCVYLHISLQNSYRDAAESAVRVLKSHSINCDISLIRHHEDNRRICVIERNSALECSIAESLIGSAVTSGTGSIDHYTSDSGSISWSIGGGIDGTLPLTVQEASSRIGQVGLKSRIYTKHSGSLSGMSLIQELDGLPIYNAVLSLSESDPGHSVISGRFLLGTPIPADTAEPMSLPAILVEFSTTSAGQLAENITSIEPGWIAQTLPGIGIRLVPVYRITADGIDTCMHAIDGTVVPTE